MYAVQVGVAPAIWGIHSVTRIHGTATPTIAIGTATPTIATANPPRSVIIIIIPIIIITPAMAVTMVTHGDGDAPLTQRPENTPPRQALQRLRDKSKFVSLEAPMNDSQH